MLNYVVLHIVQLVLGDMASCLSGSHPGSSMASKALTVRYSPDQNFITPHGHVLFQISVIEEENRILPQVGILDPISF